MAFFAIAFLAIYAPILKIFGKVLDMQGIFFLFLVGYFIFFTRHRSIFAIKKIAFPLLIVFALLLYSLFSLLFFSSGIIKIDLVLRFGRVILTYCGCAVAAYYFVRSGVEVLPAIFWAGTMHALIIIVQFLIPEFREFVYQFTADDRAFVGARYDYSMAGLANAGGAQVSVYQSVAFLIGLLLFFAPTTLLKRLLIGVSMFLVGASVFLSGRSGLLGILIFAPVVIYIAGRASKANGVVFLLFLILFVGVYGALALNWAGSIFSSDHSETLESILGRSGDVFDLQGGTYAELAGSHILFPNSAKVLLFGDPSAVALDQSSADRLVNSDIGYIRVLFGYGLIGSAMHYLFYLAVVMVGFKYRKSAVVGSPAKILVLLCVLIFVFNLKEVFVFARMGLSQVLLIYCFVVISVKFRRSAGTDSDHRLSALAGLEVSGVRHK